MDVPLSLTRRAPSPQPPDEGVRFVPAGWVTAALTVSRVVLRGGRLGSDARLPNHAPATTRER